MKFVTAISAFFALLFVLSALLVLPVSPAFSQAGQQDKFARDPALEEEMKEKKKNSKELEKEYNAVMKRTNSPTTTAASDPWASIRPSSPAKAKQ